MPDNSSLGGVQSPSASDTSSSAGTAANAAAPGGVEQEMQKERLVKFGGIGIAVLIVLLVAYHFATGSAAPVTTSTSTVGIDYNINSCTSITSPGTYYLVSNITTSIASGPCINVAADNVKLIGEQHGIIGNGPFTVNSAPSYGIWIDSHSGIVISNLTVTKFSYGIFLNASNDNMVNNVTVHNSTRSGVYIYDSHYNQLNGDRIVSTVANGGLNITLGSNNTVSKSFVEYNFGLGMSLTNTTGTQITGSAFIGNPTDLACYGNAVYTKSNKFQDSTCFQNSLCNFAYCSGNNNQSLITKVSLPRTIDSCGSINSGGAYSLTSDISLSNYMNTSITQGVDSPCILINASNVYLACSGHNITNAHYGVLARKGTFNDTVVGCGFQNDTYGMMLANLVKFQVHAISLRNNKYGLYVIYSTDGNVTNVTASKNRYGAYVNGSTYVTMTGIHATNNTNGVFIDNSTDVYFNALEALQNKGVDLYCTANVYNSTLLSIENSQCGSSDCAWAPSCPVRRLPGLALYPITGCTLIDVPGTYEVPQPIISPRTGICINIESSNVTLSCRANSTIFSSKNTGTAFGISNASNVSISGCDVGSFSNGFLATNVSGLTISGSNVSKTVTGFNISNGEGIKLLSDYVSSFAAYGFRLLKVNNSMLENDNAAYGPSGSGFWLSGAFNNSVINSTSKYGAYGMYLTNSRNNQIYNNSMLSSSAYDYYCANGSGGVLDQSNGINYGVSKFKCLWLSEVPYASAQNICSLMTSPDTIVLSQDMLYKYGSTCLDLYTQGNTSASGTVINCAGHTIRATDGGSFVSAVNTSATVENCVLIGFTDPINFTSGRQVSEIKILNDTIASTSGTAIRVNGASSSEISYNNITGALSGIMLNNINQSVVKDNYVHGASNGIYVSNGISTQVINNTVNSSASGLAIVNSQGMTDLGNKVS